MPRRTRRRAADLGVYLAVRLLVALLQALPPRWAFSAANWLALAAYHVDRRHREVARDNLARAFPEQSAAAIDELVRGCYRHCCQVLVEMVLLPRKFRLEKWRNYGRLVQAPPIVHAMFDQRATLIVTAHFGNWEFAGYALGAFGIRSYAIARTLDNPYLDRFLKRFRQATGQTILAKKDDFGRLETVLRMGGKVATLADQDAGPRGVFVDFFGRPASAHKAVALMAMEFDARLVVVGVPRTRPVNGSHGRFYYDIICEETIDPRDYAGRPDAVHAITQRYHAALERAIRRYPEQYFWLHRRWKTAPAARTTHRRAA